MTLGAVTGPMSPTQVAELREMLSEGEGLSLSMCEDMVPLLFETIAARDAEIERLRTDLDAEREGRICQTAGMRKQREALEAMVEGAEAERDDARERVRVLEAVLRFYADPSTYVIDKGVLVMDDMGNLGDGAFDLGAKARGALEGPRAKEA